VTSIGPGRLTALLGSLAGERPPLYAALAARLRLLVGDGRLPVGVRLPAERELAAALGVSRATVAAAYGRLREDGWADARQGAGTWTRLPAGPWTPATSWLPGPTEPGVTDLAHAGPSAPPEVPAAFAAALGDLPRYLPGHGYHPMGLGELRARIADRYTARGLPTTPEEVLVTGGAVHAVSVALETLVPRGGKVLVEHPSYPNALDAITALGRRGVPVAVSPDEPDEVARDVHRTVRASGPHAAYLMPDFQNPTGMLLDVAQRRRVAASLAQRDVVAVVDETLVDLGLDRAAPEPFAAIARPDLAVSVGSMSKSFWGGLRVGWLRAEQSMIRRLATVAGRTQLSGPLLEQLAACHLLDVADAVLTARRDQLREQRATLVAALARHLPDWEAPVPPGGLVLWCRLPAAYSSALVTAAATHDLLLAAGPRFGTGHALDDRLRLPYTQPSPVLARAVEQLAHVVAGLPTAAPGAPREDMVV
jgi:DNA-binding transcriptional MocR family regulator